MAKTRSGAGPDEGEQPLPAPDEHSIENAHLFPSLGLGSLVDCAARYEPIRDPSGRIVDFRYLEINDQAVEYNGISRADTLGHTLLELFPGHGSAGWIEQYAEVVETGQPLLLDEVLYPLDCADGQVRRYEMHALPAEGGFVLVWRDISERHEAHCAREMLAMANAVLVHADNETSLLRGMCGAAMVHDCFVGAAYTRTRHGNVDVVEIQQREGHPTPLSTDPLPSLAVIHEVATGGQPMVVNELGSSGADAKSCVCVPVHADGVVDGVYTVFSTHPLSLADTAVGALCDVAAQIGVGLARRRATDRLLQSIETNRLLFTAVEQAADSIILTDLTPAIIYANPATVETTGYSLSEMVGENPRLFASGFHDQLFYEAMWASLQRGEPFRGRMVNRRKSGEVYEEDASITPVRGDTGAVVAYVGVKHDLSRERRVQQELSRVHTDRTTAVRIMGELHPLETLEATADSLAEAMTQFADIDGAIVLMVGPDGEILPVSGADSNITSVPLTPGEPLPMLLSQAVIDATERGPWWVEFADQSGPAGTFPAISLAMAEAGFVIAAYAPIRWDGRVIGALSITSRSPDSPSWIDARLPVLEELGNFAGMLFGARAQMYGDVQTLRTRVNDVIHAERFDVVIQPIVDLRTEATVGHEALTRFHDGTRPHQRFNQARRVDLGSQLEAACARRAVSLLPKLPAHTWLSVNFSPETVVDGTAASVMADTDPTRIVVEITEHGAIESYPHVLEALAACGAPRLAIDDTGAGFASMRHILELRPAMVKLDMELVRGIDADPARQSLTAGLRHFCTQIGAVMIAEGVETEAEAHTLTTLGVDMAQGYLFGRPAPVPS